MALNSRDIRQQLIESILTQAVEIEKRFQTWPLEVQRQYAERHERTVAEWLQKLGPFGIEATTIVDAIDNYERLERSWNEEQIRERADLEAKFYSYLLEEEKKEINSFLDRENLVQKPESDYTLQQKAELRRIENRWTHLKTKGVSFGP
jgi:heat shock protein HspQ